MTIKKITRYVTEEVIRGEGTVTRPDSLELADDVLAPPPPVPKDTARVIDALALACYERSQRKGFWPAFAKRNAGEALALMHSELSEALEALRIGDPRSEKIPDYSQVEEEFADVIIRIMDWAGGTGLRLGGAIEAKIAHNEGRPKKHGKDF